MIAFTRNYGKFYTIHEKLSFLKKLGIDSYRLEDFLAPAWNLVVNSWRLVDKQVAVIRLSHADVVAGYLTLSSVALAVLDQCSKKRMSCPILTDIPPETVDMDDFERWKWILTEMRFAHDAVINEERYAESFWLIKPIIDDDVFSAGKLDEEAYNRHNARVQRGLEMFGKYYGSINV